MTFLRADSFIEINNSNFKEIEKHTFTVFYFYDSENCTKCESFYGMMIEEIETHYNNTNITFAKIDGPKYPTFLFMYQVSDLPTLIGMRHLNVFLYKYEYNETGFSRYLNETFRSIITSQNNKTKINDLYLSNKTVVIGYFENEHSANAEVFSTVCLVLEYMSCLIITEDSIRDEHNVSMHEDHIELIKRNHTSGSRIIYHFQGNYSNLTNLKNFIQIYDLPLFSEYNDFIKERIFDHPIKFHFIVLLKSKDTEYENIIKEIEIASWTLYSKAILVFIDADKDSNINNTLKIFNLKVDDLPIYLAVLMKDFKEKKYYPIHKKLTAVNFISFYEDIIYGKLMHMIKSEKLPNNWNNGDVKILARENYKNVTGNQNFTVAVNFYSEDCIHCQILQPIWEEVGKLYSNSSDVIIARINYIANDIDDLFIHSTPSIFLYRKINKNPIRYEGKRNLRNIIRFIKNDGKMEGNDDDDEDELTNEEKDEL